MHINILRLQILNLKKQLKLYTILNNRLLLKLHVASKFIQTGENVN